MKTTNAIALISVLLMALASKASPQVSVFFSPTAPASLQTDFIGKTTAYFDATITNSYLPGSYYLTITSSKPVVVVIPGISTPTVNASDLLAALVAVSSSAYPYGWADGMQNERNRDLSFLNNYLLNCSSAPYFKASTSTWKVDVCTTTLNAAFAFIYQQNFSTPIAPPGQ